jgi:hypothetical protein
MKVTVIRDEDLTQYLESKITTRPDYGPWLEGRLARQQEEIMSRYHRAKLAMDEIRKKANAATKRQYNLR